MDTKLKKYIKKYTMILFYEWQGRMRGLLQLYRCRVTLIKTVLKNDNLQESKANDSCAWRGEKKTLRNLKFQVSNRKYYRTL